MGGWLGVVEPHRGRGRGTRDDTASAAPLRSPIVVRPRIKGTLEVGQVVRVSKGVWKPAAVTFKYQWYAGAKAITDATHRRLTLTAKYVGKRLTVRVKAKAAGYDRGHRVDQANGSDQTLNRAVAARPTSPGRPPAGSADLDRPGPGPPLRSAGRGRPGPVPRGCQVGLDPSPQRVQATMGSATGRPSDVR